MAKVETERFFGKKGIIIMIRDGNKMVSAIFKDKKNADKFNRNKPADVKKLLQLAKKTKFPKAIDEDTDVGHQDDEPNMLKSTALEIMEYGKKLMDKLDKYDDMEGEVDFPNWWQSKLTLAKDYLQKAYHYLDSEEKTSETIDRSFRTYRDDEGDDEGPVDEGKKKNESVNEDDMVFDPKTKSFKIKSGSMNWEKNFKWANDKELKVISKFIFMNPKGIDGVIKMSKHKPFAFRRTIQKMAKKGLHEGYGPFIKAKNLNDIIKLSKQKKNATFYVTDDNNSRIGTFYLKNGKFAKATTANPNYDFQRNKTNLKDRSDVIYKYKVDESVNEAFVVAYGKGPKPIKPAFAAYADKKMAQKFMADLKKDGYKVMMTQKKIRGIDEDKNQIVQLKKKVGKSEIKFYDALSKIEKKLGKKKYRAFLEKGLKDFKINAKHYDYRSNGAAEEKLFQLAK